MQTFRRGNRWVTAQELKAKEVETTEEVKEAPVGKANKKNKK